MTAYPTTTQAPATDPVQRRTLRVLFAVQVIGGVGVAIGISVGALLARDMAGTSLAGLAQSVAVVGAGIAAVPVARITRQYGRRPALATAYLTGAVGGILVVAAALAWSVPLLFGGLFLFGSATTANLQARYAAVDLAPSHHRGRHLSLIVWATTLGAVAGPNFAPLAGRAVSGTDLPTLAGPFVFSAALFGVVALVLFGLLRPDPLRLARQRRDVSEPGAAGGESAGARAGLAAIVANPAARLGMVAAAVGYVVMVAVMVMTPVHIHHAGHSDADTLRLVGVVISIHIAGMYAFAPVMGWLADRIGRRQVILLGVVLLIAACAFAGTAGYGTPQLSIGLFLLGLGWSATMVAGSTLLTEAVPESLRPAAQGVSDLVMLLSGAVAGAVAGVVMAATSYPTLNLLAALVTIPLVALALRRVRTAPATGTA